MQHSTQQFENPYVDALDAHPEITITDSHTAPQVIVNTGERGVRRDFVTEYAWAIPTLDVVTQLATHAPIIEIGAGNGYWASRIEQQNGSVTAIDVNPPETTWTTVKTDRHTVVREYPDHALLLCWPSYAADWPGDVIRRYTGETLIYIGEGHGGRTGSAAMHEAISEGFGLADTTMQIPQWRSTHDKVYIFTRSGRSLETR